MNARALPELKTKAAAPSPALPIAARPQLKSLANPSAGSTDHAPSVGSEVAPIVQEGLRSPGQPLDPSTRNFMEPRFGHDFGNVRVHTDAGAAESARAVNALAYTIGPNIVLPPDQYKPASIEGRKLLAHELTHVLQQTGADGTNASEEAAEKEADRNAVTSQGENNLAVEITAPGKLQRQPATAGAESTAALTDIDRIVRAAERARRESSNATTMMINGSEIVYRMIHEFLPDYDSKLSGVSYRAGLKEVGVEAEKGSISITVGNDFIFGTNKDTLELRALDLGRAIFAKAPRPGPAGKRPGLLGGMAIEAKKAPVKAPPVSESKPPLPPELLVETAFDHEVPGLGPEKRAKVEELIKAKDIQGAIDMIVQFGGGAGGSKIDRNLLVDGKMTYDPGMTVEDGVTEMPGWHYPKGKEKEGEATPGKVRIGQPAFSSVPYLYSVIMHEYQHVLWNQSEKNQEIGKETHEFPRQGGGMYTSEAEAYAWELLHATESGLSQIPEKLAGVWRNLNEEYWKLDPAAQKAMLPKVLPALAEAKRFVKGTKVTLDPFKKP